MCCVSWLKLWGIIWKSVCPLLIQLSYRRRHRLLLITWPSMKYCLRASRYLRPLRGARGWGVVRWCCSHWVWESEEGGHVWNTHTSDARCTGTVFHGHALDLDAHRAIDENDFGYGGGGGGAAVLWRGFTSPLAYVTSPLADQLWIPPTDATWSVAAAAVVEHLRANHAHAHGHTPRVQTLGVLDAFRWKASEFQRGSGFSYARGRLGGPLKANSKLPVAVLSLHGFVYWNSDTYGVTFRVDKNHCLLIFSLKTIMLVSMLLPIVDL